VGDSDGLFLGSSGGGIEVVVGRGVAFYGGCLDCFCDLEGDRRRHFGGGWQMESWSLDVDVDELQSIGSSNHRG